MQDTPKAQLQVASTEGFKLQGPVSKGTQVLSSCIAILTSFSCFACIRKSSTTCSVQCANGRVSCYARTGVVCHHDMSDAA